MKTYYGNYLGIVIDNNDPEFRGRVQVFVPHIMPTLYEDWNKKGKDITITCVGDNMPQGLTSEITDRLKKILPWAESASPIVGQSASGGVMSALASALTNVGQAAATAITNVGQAAADAIAGTPSSTESPSQGAQNLDQTPSTIPQGSLPPGDFVQRLNGFYQEATALGYKVICSSGFRAPQKQKDLYDADIRKHGRPSGAVAKPGNSAHEYGIAVDLKVSGNGVSIQTINAAADRTSNRDTPAFRSLLAKYNLHQPLHPDGRSGVAEKWHVEPTETNKAGGDRGAGPFTAVSQKMGGSSVPPVSETPSSSQMPPAASPLQNKSPSGTDKATPTSPTTGLVPVPAAASPALPISTPGAASPTGTLTPSTLPTAPEGQPISTGPTTGATPTGGTNQLANDRIARFGAEVKDPQVLDRMEYVLKREGGGSARLIFETACNRAMFGNKTLKETLFQRAYFKTAKDPNATATTPHTQFTLDMVQKVIYGGANETNLATDQAYNDKNLFAKKFIDAGATGDWFDLLKGQKITDPGRITSLSTKPGTGNEEFIYRKDGHGDARSNAGLRAKEYALKYNIQPTTPSTFNSNAPLPPNLEAASKSPLTDKPYNTNAANPPTTVNNTDPHGPTIVKNTNDAAKGMFAFPGVGAMVWIFFREGNPQFPVYFAASYGANEWKSAYNGASLNPEGTNNGTVGSQLANSMKLNPNAGGGLEFTHVKDASDPSGANDKAVAMLYGDDGSNITFSKGFHQIYTRHDRRDQVDGHFYNIIGGTEEKWIEDDSSVNIKGNVTIKIGKVDLESIEAMKELSDFSKQLNDTLMSNSSK